MHTAETHFETETNDEKTVLENAKRSTEGENYAKCAVKSKSEPKALTKIYSAFFFSASLLRFRFFFGFLFVYAMSLVPLSSIRDVSALTFSPDSRYLIAGIGSFLHLFDVSSSVPLFACCCFESTAIHGLVFGLSIQFLYASFCSCIVLCLCF